MKEETTQELKERLAKETEIEEALEDFNSGPTAGTLNDKRRMARIYELLLKISHKLY